MTKPIIACSSVLNIFRWKGIIKSTKRLSPRVAAWMVSFERCYNFCALKISSRVVCPLPVCVAALPTSIWYLNFSVRRSRAVQNIYKSRHGTVIINLTNFASAHNNNNDKKWTKIGLCLLFRTMFLSGRRGGTRVCDLWNRSSSRKRRMFLIRLSNQMELWSWKMLNILSHRNFISIETRHDALY